MSSHGQHIDEALCWRSWSCQELYVDPRPSLCECVQLQLHAYLTILEVKTPVLVTASVSLTLSGPQCNSRPVHVSTDFFVWGKISEDKFRIVASVASVTHRRTQSLRSHNKDTLRAVFPGQLLLATFHCEWSACPKNSKLGIVCRR